MGKFIGRDQGPRVPPELKLGSFELEEYLKSPLPEDAPKPEKPKARVCLNCKKSFESPTRFKRLCPICTNQAGSLGFGEFDF